ncbi:MAG: hypothetical protein ABR530_08890 [Pyrinomonadaceae bacterium]
MYRRPKVLEVLLEIRREMAVEADYDVDLFAEMARSGKRPSLPRKRVFPVRATQADRIPVAERVDET